MAGIESRLGARVGDSSKSQRRALLGDEDATMVFETSKGVEVVPTFDQMGLKDDLLRGIYAYGMSPPVCSYPVARTVLSVMFILIV